MAFYVLCDDNSKHESMTKEQILSAIAHAIETGNIGDCDTGFITKIKDRNAGKNVSFWVGTEAEFNAISPAPESRQFIARIDNEGNVYICNDEVSAKQIGAVAALAGEEHNGDFLRVVDGVATWVTIHSAEGGSF